MGFGLGKDAKLYRSTGGTFAAPTWAVINNVKDLTLNLEGTEIDVSTRGGGGFKQRVIGLLDGSFEFDMVWDPSDAAFTALQAAFFARTTVLMGVFDKDVTVAGAQGLKADMSVLNFTREEPLEGAIMAKVKLAPGYSANTPVWFTTP